jgi:hypothetical protein
MDSKKKKDNSVFLGFINGSGIKANVGMLIDNLFINKPNLALKFDKIIIKMVNIHPIFKSIHLNLLKISMKHLVVIENKEKLIEYLKQLKSMDLGSSVVVSGLFSEVNDALHSIGLRPHTVQFSLGIFGKKELLPQEKILDITTMCGHGQISFQLVIHLVNNIAKNKMSTQDAAELISEQCPCSAVNKTRIIKLLEYLVGRANLDKS